MTRGFILFAVMTVLAGPLPAYLAGPGTAAGGQMPAAIVGVAGPVALVGQPVLQDNFDDNRKATLWRLYQEDPNCRVVETNKRLELITAPDPNSPFAGYIGDGWWIDPNHDFAMKVDMRYDPVTLEGGWFVLGLTPNLAKPRSQYISFGIGSVTNFPNFYREWRDGYEIRWDFVGRVQNPATVYIFYDARWDTLYLSDTGYGPEFVWETIPDLIHSRWPRKPLYVFLGGSTEGVQIDSGRAYADNFVIEQGTVVKSTPGQPGEPNLPPGGSEVAASVLITPSVITRDDDRTRTITAVASLPEGFRVDDWDDTQPTWLSPGNLAATSQSGVAWFNGTAIIIASFSKALLMQAIPDNGQVQIRFTGRLKDQRDFSGTYTVTIR